MLKTFSDYGSEEGENIKSEFCDIHEGLFYMPEAGNHRVSVFDLDGNFKFLFSGLGVEEGKLNNPEAARAGVHGKGFAVVAQEVRNLASRSSKAAGETAELIEGAMKRVQTGAEVTSEAVQSFEKIVHGLSKVTDLVAEIASANSEQSLGL